MKLLNAWSAELDDTEVFVSEILEQLDLENNALANSAGFITCSCDFVETGMVKAICDALPFETVGCTTLTNANNDVAGTMLFCLTVLTADDCSFSTAVTGSLRGDLEDCVNTAAKTAAAKLDQPVKVAFAFLPLFEIGGEIVLNALDKAIDGAPIFGTIGCDLDTALYSNTVIIHDGECYKDAMSFLLVTGNVNPRFVVTSTSEQNLSKQLAVITSSEGSRLKRVNNMTAKEYFESIGLIAGKGVEGLISIPFVVDYNDGTQPIARAIYGLNEDGSADCGGIMPEGGTLYIGRMNVEDILLTTEESLKQLLKNDDINGIIMFPCLGRNMVLAMEPLAEINVAENLIGNTKPWHLAYSGGECCPVYKKDLQTINRFHNFTFIGCAL